MVLNANVPQNQWLGIGFGEGMINVDMVLMQGKDDGIMRDLWSTFYFTPKFDNIDNWEDKQITKNGNVYSFKAFRKLNTGDAAEDTVLECGKTYKF